MYLENGIRYFSTSSSAAFKRCRRKWYFQNIMGFTTPQNKYMWIGSCFHKLLEQLHKGDPYDNAMTGIQQFIAKTKQQDLPDDLDTASKQIIGMYEVYTDYMYNFLPPNRYRTYTVGDVPQTEVKMTLDVGIEDSEGHPVRWKGIIDRVIEDTSGDLWLIDYKTKSTIDTSLLDLDPQISNYLMGAPYWYGRPIRGMIYIQVVRAAPQYPSVGKRGDVSVAKNQLTTAKLYEEALLDVYGSPENIPQKQESFLNKLILEEGVSGNKYIQVDRVFRNEEQHESALLNLRQEAKDQINALESEHLYPNPTRDCNWDCDFMVPCLLKEEQRIVTDYLQDNFEQREEVKKQ